jgi:nucleotide-binding universal stress UspA family protein
MTMTILVGYDPETADRAPVDFGAAAARFTGAPLVVGSVFADSVVVGRIGHGRMEEDLASDASEALDHLQREMVTRGIHAEFQALPGPSAPAALHAAVESFNAGLLVVGSTDRGRIGELLPGSTAARLMHGAPCPIAVVPHAWQGGGGVKTLGVAFVDTPEGRQALESGVALARAAGAKLRVLCAVKPHHYGKVAGEGPGTEGTTYDELGVHMQEATRRALDEATAEARDLDVDVDVSVQDAADFLIAASDQLDLMVCGSRGYGPRRAVLLGGVSLRVTASARCPVIVLARGAEYGLEALVDERQGAVA